MGSDAISVSIGGRIRRWVVVRHRVLAVCLTVVVAVPLLTWAISAIVSGRSSATVRIQLLSGQLDAFLPPNPIDPYLLRLDATVVRELPAAMDAVRLLPDPPTTTSAFESRARRLARSLRVVPDVHDGTLSITATSDSPQMAHMIAKAFAEGLLALRRAQSVDMIDSLVTDLARSAEGVHGVVRAHLIAQIADLRSVLKIEGQQTEIDLPSTPATAITLQALAGLAIALLLALAILVGWSAAHPAAAAERNLGEAASSNEAPEMPHGEPAEMRT